MHDYLQVPCHSAHYICSCTAVLAHGFSPIAYQSLGPLAPKPYTYKLIGMLGAIITYMTIILLGYTAVGITGGSADGQPGCVGNSGMCAAARCA